MSKLTSDNIKLSIINKLNTGGFKEIIQEHFECKLQWWIDNFFNVKVMWKRLGKKKLKSNYNNYFKTDPIKFFAYNDDYVLCESFLDTEEFKNIDEKFLEKCWIRKFGYYTLDVWSGPELTVITNPEDTAIIAWTIPDPSYTNYQM